MDWIPKREGAEREGAEREGAEREGAETEGRETEGRETEGRETEGAQSFGARGARLNLRGDEVGNASVRQGERLAEGLAHLRPLDEERVVSMR